MTQLTTESDSNKADRRVHSCGLLVSKGLS